MHKVIEKRLAQSDRSRIGFSAGTIYLPFLDKHAVDNKIGRFCMGIALSDRQINLSTA
jgi:hypothetical protein